MKYFFVGKNGLIWNKLYLLTVLLYFRQGFSLNFYFWPVLKILNLTNRVAFVHHFEVSGRKEENCPKNHQFHGHPLVPENFVYPKNPKVKSDIKINLKRVSICKFCIKCVCHMKVNYIINTPVFISGRI